MDEPVTLIGNGFPYLPFTLHERILARPHYYLGSANKRKQKLWVYEEEKMVYRSVTYVPALYKIFEEILENAADNFHRDPSMDSLKVEIDPEACTISVFNNGNGIPVTIHPENKVYIPEMVFGQLYTSSNYNRNVKSTTGGRRGCGAKFANIFSTEFVVETADGLNKYKQVFTNNMWKKTDPEITKCKRNENWTKVTFKPDLVKFEMKYLEGDVLVLMKTRVLEMAACLGKSVKVKLNGSLLPINSFKDYVDLYLKSAEKYRKATLPRIHHKAGDRWEICVSLSDEQFQQSLCDGKFQQVSFVNSVATIKGGTHVDYITDQITTYVMNKVHEKNKDAVVQANNVKKHLWVFVNALIDNPDFIAQTKHSLATSQASFGSKCVIPESKLKDVANFGIVETVLLWASIKPSKDLKKADGTKTQMIGGIVKLEDANDIGGRNSEMTQLEHILLRPDIYVGSFEKQTQSLLVYENDKFVNRSISYVPALYKIFEEVLLTAADNKQRDPSMDSLYVTIDPAANTVSVYNNGYGVPVKIHPKEKVYIPELIFGRLRTSSNYNVDVKKTSGGRKGCGAKFANIFSTEFVVETADGLNKYKQVFTNNMEKKSDPEITKCEANENWTKVTFKPDLEKFKMKYLEEDVVVLMKTRVLEMARCLGKSVKVKLNGSLLPIKSFKDNVDLYSVQPPAAEAGKKKGGRKPAAPNAKAPAAKAPASTKKRKLICCTQLKVQGRHRRRK